MRPFLFPHDSPARRCTPLVQSRSRPLVSAGPRSASAVSPPCAQDMQLAVLLRQGWDFTCSLAAEATLHRSALVFDPSHYLVSFRCFATGPAAGVRGVPSLPRCLMFSSGHTSLNFSFFPKTAVTLSMLCAFGKV